jgi:hypothetical protein
MTEKEPPRLRQAILTLQREQTMAEQKKGGLERRARQKTKKRKIEGMRDSDATDFSDGNGESGSENDFEVLMSRTLKTRRKTRTRVAAAPAVSVRTNAGRYGTDEETDWDEF